MSIRALTILLLGLLAVPSFANPPGAIESLHIVIPGGAGGGWDRTARGVGQALMDAGLVEQIRYENMSGGGGAKGIAHVIEVGAQNMWLVNSTPIVVRALRKVFPQSFRDLTPIASVIGDYSVIAVRQQSELLNLQDLAQVLHTNPRQMAIAGGSVPGGTDHIVAAMIVAGLGGDPKTTKYIPYDAGGKAMAGLLSGEVQALSSGFGEVYDLAQQGWVRILCVAAPERLVNIPKVPTCIEAGAEAAVFVNWRGFFAPRDLPKNLTQQYRQVLADMLQSPEWTTIRNRNGWVDLYRPGPSFTAMLEEQERSVGSLMRSLGLL